MYGFVNNLNVVAKRSLRKTIFLVVLVAASLLLCLIAGESRCFQLADLETPFCPSVVLFHSLYLFKLVWGR
jgi:hypothetical protein